MAVSDPPNERKGSQNHEQLTQLLQKSNAFVEKMEHSRQNSTQMRADDIPDDDSEEERDEVLEIEDAQTVIIEPNPPTKP